MAYLFAEQRADFAEKVIDAIGIDDDFIKETFKKGFLKQFSKIRVEL